MRLQLFILQVTKGEWSIVQVSVLLKQKNNFCPFLNIYHICWFYICYQQCVAHHLLADIVTDMKQIKKNLSNADWSSEGLFQREKVAGLQEQLYCTFYPWNELQIQALYVFYRDPTLCKNHGESDLKCPPLLL